MAHFQDCQIFDGSGFCSVTLDVFKVFNVVGTKLDIKKRELLFSYYYLYCFKDSLRK